MVGLPARITAPHRLPSLPFTAGRDGRLAPRSRSELVWPWKRLVESNEVSRRKRARWSVFFFYVLALRVGGGPGPVAVLVVAWCLGEWRLLLRPRRHRCG